MNMPKVSTTNTAKAHADRERNRQLLLTNRPESAALTQTFSLQKGVWQAQFRGRINPATFNSKGAAQAWIDTCEAKGEYRS